jgi:selenocysteine-specific elongation factor
MPQTREHLAILDLLQVKGGVVALTKVDLLQDHEWIDLVSADIRKELDHSVFANAKIIPVSSKTRGITDLLNELDRLLQVVTAKNDLGKPRLPIDRVFSMSGFGTVVTGTLIDGSFAVGDEIEIVPGGTKGRIRGLQTHKEKLDRAIPGSRVAINLSGLSVDELSRGQVVVRPGTYSATTLVDAQVQYLASAPKSLAHNAEVDFFSGSSQVPAHVRLLDQEELKPGANGWIQLHLSQAVALVKKDRFIIRFPSPSITVGGGFIVDPHAQTRHRRFKRDVIARLETLAQGSPEELVVQFLTGRGANPADEKEIVNATNLKPENLRPILDSRIQSGEIIALGTGSYLSSAAWRGLTLKMGQALDDFHRAFPLRSGMPREEMKSKLGLAPRIFDQVIENVLMEKVMRANADVLLRPDFSIAFKPELQKKVDTLLAQFNKSPYSPPSAQEAEDAIGAEALGTLVAQEKLIRLNEAVVLSPQAFATMRESVIAIIGSKGQITAAEVRDQFKTSRKYAIALLEYLDEKRITKRVGDARVLR